MVFLLTQVYWRFAAKLENFKSLYLKIKNT